ncbi:MAG: serine hydrolase domain-containing protein [Mycobacteriales bacterium]
MTSTSELTARLADLCDRFGVPGAALAVATAEEQAVAWTGTANLRTGLPVQRDTLFAAGSVTKVFTATLLMTLLDDGLVDLDAPVVGYLPELAEAKDPRLIEITVGMLLDHTSGLPGSVTYDVPRGPQVVSRFVDLLLGTELNSPPGRFWSYSNGGLVLAGRVAEVLTGMAFEDALDQRVLRPLGLNATSRLDDMLLQSTAVGHVPGQSGETVVTPRLQLGTNSPSGSGLWCDIAALLAFGQLHLERGVAADGKQVLSADAVALMQQPRLEVPWTAVGYEHMGIGWLRRQTAAGPLLGHTGASAGQHSCLYILPEQGAVLAALTNSTNGAAVYTTLMTELLAELFDVIPVAPPAVADDQLEVPLEPLVGTYVADEGQVVVTLEDERLVATHECTPSFVDTMRLIMGPTFPPPPMTLTPYDGDGRFVSDIGMPAHFIQSERGGHPEFAYFGRLYRRSSS